MAQLFEAVMKNCLELGSQGLIHSDKRVFPAERFVCEVDNLAAELQRFGVRCGSRVGLALASGIELMTAIWAVWKLDCSFVPLNPDDTSERAAQMLADADVLLTLYCPKTIGKATGATANGLVCMGSSLVMNGRVREHKVGFAGEAYVIFTSGSTGRPKGVSVGQRQIFQYLSAAARRYRIPNRAMACPVGLPVTFDAALTSLLLPLLTQNEVHFLPNPDTLTVGLSEFLKCTGLPVLVKTTPAQLRMLTNLMTPLEWMQLSGTFVIGGEALDFADLTLPRSGGKLSLHNEYGPTETTVGCSSHEITEMDPGTGPVPVGIPFPGTQFVLEPQADDGSGSAGLRGLTVVGAQVANGYLGKSDDALGRFSSVGGAQSYQTGDLFRRNENGSLIFVGRCDDQIKLNGIRIELGEVEAALRAASKTNHVAVVHVDGRLLGAFAEPVGVPTSAIVARLRELLPPQMVPTSVHGVAAIPLTEHGKIDRLALVREIIQAELKKSVSETVTDDRQEVVAAVWRDLLGLPFVSRETDFFAAGGHSILALKLTGRLSSKFGCELPLMLVFDAPRFGIYWDAVRVFLDTDGQNAGTESGKESPRSIAPVQEAIITAHTLAERAALYTVVSAVEVKNLPPLQSLFAAVSTTLAAHDIFSWRFASGPNHEATATANDGSDAVGVETIDLRRLSTEEQETVIANRIQKERLTNIDLLAGARPRIVLFQTSNSGATCILVAHHALVDEHALSLFWTDVFDRAAGTEPAVPPPGHYAAWAARSRSASERERARNMAENIAQRLCEGPIGKLVTTNVSSGQLSSPFETVRFGLDPDLKRRIEARARGLALPLSSVYLSAFVLALEPLITGRRFSILMPITLRRSEEDFGTVGCFVTALPVVCEFPSGMEGPGEFIRRMYSNVSFTLGNAGANQLDLRAMVQGSSLPNISISFSELPHTVRRCGVDWKFVPEAEGPPKYDLSLFISVGSQDAAGEGRIVYVIDALTKVQSGVLARTYLSKLLELCSDDVLQSAGTSMQFPPETLALPNRSLAVPDSPFVSELCQIFSEILGHPVESNDSLFESGGQSMHLIQLIGIIEDRYSARIGPGDIFDASTPFQLAGLISLKYNCEPARRDELR